MSQDLATLAADPERVEQIPSTALPGLIGELEALRARLWARLQASVAPAPPAAAPPANGGPDRLLTVKEAAARLGVGPRWLYRHTELPFRRQLSTGAVRFSERGLERWKESRK